MNERIKELAGQAKIMAEEDINRKISYNAELKAFAEKFAELLVQECIVQTQLTTARDPQTSVQYRQSVGHIHRIRQHFGIE